MTYYVQLSAKSSEDQKKKVITSAEVQFSASKKSYYFRRRGPIFGKIAWNRIACHARPFGVPLLTLVPGVADPCCRLSPCDEKRNRVSVNKAPTKIFSKTPDYPFKKKKKKKKENSRYKIVRFNSSNGSMYHLNQHYQLYHFLSSFSLLR